MIQRDFMYSLQTECNRSEIRQNPTNGSMSKQMKTLQTMLLAVSVFKYEIPTMDHENMPQLIPNDPEVKRVRSLASHVQEFPSDTILGRLESFSDWYRAKRAIAACLKLKAKMVSKAQTRQLCPRSNTKSKAYEPVKVDQICKAEMIIIRLVQKEAFKDELSVLHTLQVGEVNSGREVAKKRNNAMKQTSSLFRLDPYVDSYGLKLSRRSNEKC